MAIYILREGFSNKFKIEYEVVSGGYLTDQSPAGHSSSFHIFEAIDVDQDEVCESILQRRLSSSEFFCALADNCFLLDPILVLTIVRDVRRWFAGLETATEAALGYANDVRKATFPEPTREDGDVSPLIQASGELIFLRSNASYWKICLSN